MTQQQRQDAIAITGLGAVFPGAGDAAAFWRNIKAGTDAITEVTPDRWDPAVYCDPVQGGAAPFYTRRGGFLGELATFNPGPFGIMPSSVDGTEPDQLLMLREDAADKTAQSAGIVLVAVITELALDEDARYHRRRHRCCCGG